MATIGAAVAAYEEWLVGQLGDLLRPVALVRKHDRMRNDAGDFLRATCFRWAATAPAICPDLAGAPEVFAIGDCHVENFGLWRDAEGRMVWGVNDFDEAAPMPFAFDLVRLAASALLKHDEGKANAREIAELVLRGYRDGLAAPMPFVLERRHTWLRRRAAASRAEREKFWTRLGALPDDVPPAAFLTALQAVLPHEAGDVRFKSREAGLGGLGLARFVAIASFRGDDVVREAKAMVPSCWAPAQAPGAGLVRLARGPHRSPDPWLDLHGSIALRRLGPNSRKLEFDAGAPRLGRRLLAAMGFEVANIHAAEPQAAARISDDLRRRRGAAWLANAARATAAATLRDWRAYRGG